MHRPQRIPQMTEITDLFGKIKEVELQIEKMTRHWRSLRQVESKKKKERQIKISKGEIEKRHRRKALGISRRYCCPV
jgi:hypothetical protein